MPRQTLDTRSPVEPRFTYFIRHLPPGSLATGAVWPTARPTCQVKPALPARKCPICWRNCAHRGPRLSSVDKVAGPSATYRVQFGLAFTFDDAANMADYLSKLGVSHLYCSPLLQAAATSSAGYDVVDYARLDDRLGGDEGYGKLTARLRAAGIGQVLDIVPNHMALAGRANAWWWDVLENGPASLYASYFDIDWDPPERKLAATVLMPVLGDQYGRVLEAGELVL